LPIDGAGLPSVKRSLTEIALVAVRGRAQPLCLSLARSADPDR
jgi:hypothetical protein